MRNDSLKWTASDEVFGLETEGLSLVPFKFDRLTLVSGPRDAALRISNCSNAHGWPEPISDERHALSLRRDRILVVNGPQQEDGWHDAHGLAVSDATHTLAGFDLSGAHALSALNTLAEVDPSRPSAGCALMLKGIPTVLCRLADADRYRLFVPPGYAAALIGHLNT